MPTNPAFLMYPDEAAVIGRIVAGYGDLEYLLSHCLSAALGNRPSVFRAFFRLRGEQQRVDVTDALMRHHYEAAGLINEYSEMIGAMRWCRSLRNQYAHCHWASHKDAGLFFTNMEDPAKKAGGPVTFKMYHVDLPLLIKQEEYTAYTSDILLFIRHNLEYRRDEVPSHGYSMPKIISQPQLYNPQEQHPLPRTA
jgi:hypothetical protein